MNIAVRDSAGVPVTLAPFPLDPDKGRQTTHVLPGTTLADAIGYNFPALPEEAMPRVQAHVVDPGKDEATIIPRWEWAHYRLAQGAAVVIRIGPAGPFAMLAVQGAAMLASSLGGTAMAGVLGLSAAAWGSIIGLGVTLIGGLLVNLLFPTKKPKEDRPSYLIEGFRNEARPDQPIPMPLGRVRSAPPLGATSYVEIVNGVLYTRALLINGIGQYRIFNERFGSTPISRYKNVQFEHRNIVGHPDISEPLTLWPNQVFAERVGTNLEMLLKRNDDGSEAGGWDAPNVETRYSASNGTRCEIIFAFPQGILKMDEDGDKHRFTVSFRLRVRAVGATDWWKDETISFSDKKGAALYRSYPIVFPTRGEYEIELRRIIPSEEKEDHKNSYLYQSQWLALQTFRPEYPINTDLPISVTAIRAKASHFMNGMIEEYSRDIEPVSTGFGNGWPTTMESNNATTALHAILGPGLFEPELPADVEWPEFVAWRTFCQLKGITFKYEFRTFNNLEEVLQIIGAAGRAKVYHDGLKWRVIIDRPQETARDLISPRNASAISFERYIPDLPDALKVIFQDEENKFERAERIVPRPGIAPENVRSIIQTEMPGVTNARNIYLEASRKLLEMEHRQVAYSMSQKGVARTATAGDLVKASQDIIEMAMASAKVVSVRGDYITIDDEWQAEPGIDYAVTFRVPKQAEPGKWIHELVVRKVSLRPGWVRGFRFTDDKTQLPVPGDLVTVGPFGNETIPLILTGIIHREDGDDDLLLTLAADEIDAKVDAISPPAWDGKVGEIKNFAGLAPEIPKIVAVELNSDGSVTVQAAPTETNYVPIETFTLHWRRVGTTPWSANIVAPAADGTFTIAGSFANGDQLEFQVLATGFGSSPTSSAWSAIIASTLVGSVRPGALDEASINIVPKLGYVEITFATGPDINTKAIAIVRDGVRLPATVPVSPNGTFGRIDGDSTRVPLINDIGFDDSTKWTATNQFAVTGSQGVKTAGASISLLYQAWLTQPQAGDVIRWGVDIASNNDAGGFNLFNRTTPTTGTNTTAIPSGTGMKLGTLTIAAAETYFGITAASNRAAALNSLVAFKQTPACLGQGSHTYQLIPVNDDGEDGPASAIRTVTVI